MGWYQRIKYENQPQHARVHDHLMREVAEFLAYDRDLLLKFTIEFTGTEGEMNNANIRVYLPNEDMRKLELLNTYHLGGLKDYKQMVDRVYAGSITGAVEDESNLLFNGLFDKGDDGLQGWSIESQSGDAQLLVTNGILQVSEDTDPGGPITLVNRPSVLSSLQSYKTTINVMDLSASASVQLKLGSQAGTLHSTTGVKNESIVSSGLELRIVVNLQADGQNAKIAYIILGKE